MHRIKQGIISLAASGRAKQSSTGGQLQEAFWVGSEHL